MISSCPLLLSQTIRPKLEMKLTNTIEVIDVTQVLDAEVKAQRKQE